MLTNVAKDDTILGRCDLDISLYITEVISTQGHGHWFLYQLQISYKVRPVIVTTRAGYKKTETVQISNLTSLE